MRAVQANPYDGHECADRALSMLEILTDQRLNWLWFETRAIAVHGVEAKPRF